MATDPAELVNGRETAENGVVLDFDMAGQRRGIGHDHPVVNLAVVGHVRIGHEQVVVADHRLAATIHRAAVQGGKLADAVAIADDQPGFLAAVLEILRVGADRSELEDLVVTADIGPALDDHVSPDLGAGTDFDLFTDDAVGPDTDPSPICADG